MPTREDKSGVAHCDDSLQGRYINRFTMFQANEDNERPFGRKPLKRNNKSGTTDEEN